MTAGRKPIVRISGWICWGLRIPSIFLPDKDIPAILSRPGRSDCHQFDESDNSEHILNSMHVYTMAICELNDMRA